MSPNRIAVLLGILQAIAAALLPILGAVTTPLQVIVLSVAIVAITALLIVFLIGWQRHEARLAQDGQPAEPFPLSGLSQVVSEVSDVIDKARAVVTSLEPALPILQRLGITALEPTPSVRIFTPAASPTVMTERQPAAAPPVPPAYVPPPPGAVDPGTPQVAGVINPEVTA